jgi:hypothetical protein
MQRFVGLRLYNLDLKKNNLSSCRLSRCASSGGLAVRQITPRAQLAHGPVTRRESS